ncbi:MAG: hypothetical protein GXP14_12470 [Gammaproteobacteria bacterium]|nr:hypothetical protein [Gammaproteobacteria bacterium]
MTLTATEHYLAGDLSAAISTVENEIRDQPSNTAKRVFLAELLCFNDDFDRADKQLNTVLAMDAKTALTVGVWRQLIRAAQTRHDVYEVGATPGVIENPTPRIENALALLLALRENKTEDYAELVAKIDRDASAAKFQINDKAVSDWRDLDDINAGILEVLASNGKYFWVDFSQIVKMQLCPPERPLDLLWRKTNITLTNGTEGEVFIPSVYPGIKEDDAIKLARKTDWIDQGGIVRGQGLRTWLVGEEACSIVEINTVENTNLTLAETA